MPNYYQHNGTSFVHVSDHAALETRLAEADEMLREAQAAMDVWANYNGHARWDLAKRIEAWRATDSASDDESWGKICDHCGRRYARSLAQCPWIGCPSTADQPSSAPAGKHTATCSYWDGLMAQICNCGATPTVTATPEVKP